MTIIAYAYDADIHCPICTGNRFADRVGFGDVATDNGASLDGWNIPVDAVDRKGNPICPISSWDETSASLPIEDGGHDLVCGDCLEIIRKHYSTKKE